MLRAVAVAPVALAVGFVVAQGPLFALLISITLGALLWIARPRVSDRLREPHPFAFALTLLAVVAMPSSAVRINESLTASDALLVLGYVALAGGTLLSLARGVALPRIPPWLLIGAGGLAVAALLVELFPPDQVAEFAIRGTATSLYDRNNPAAPAGDVAAASNAVIAARFVATLLGVPLLLGVLASSWHRVASLVNVWLVGVAINCAVALLSWLNVISAADIVGRDYVLLGGGGADRLVGLTVHPTHLGTIAALALPVVFVRLAGRVRPGDVLLALLFILGIMVSGTRAAVIGAFAGLGAMLMFQRGLRIRGVTIAGVAALAAFVAGITNRALFSIVDRLASGSTSATTSDVSRSQAFADTFHDIIERPVVGYGFEVVRGGHNLYLELAHAGGIVALAAFLYFAVGLLRSAQSLGKDTTLPDASRTTAIGLTGAVVTWLTLSLFQNSVFDRFLYIPVGLLVALVINARSSVARTKPNLHMKEDAVLPLAVSRRPIAVVKR